MRVRFAPSPTGHLHVGGARTALFNYLAARGSGGTFILRSDDTDTERNDDAFYTDIVDGLRWLGLDWDEGIEVGGPHGTYRQSDRLGRYQQVAEELIGGGRAYRCYCTAAELEERRAAAREEGRPPGYDGRCRTLDPAESSRRAGEKHSIRMAVPRPGVTVFTDAIRGEVAFDHDHVDDFVMLRSTGVPTYHLASTVDDVDYEITHVIRGEDLLSSTPKHILITAAMGSAAEATYAHLPLIQGPDGRKLSKRHGDTSVRAYRDAGYLPEAVVNYLALLGWSGGGEEDEDVVPLSVMVEEFDLGEVSKNPAVFDPAKLQWLNGVYIRDLPEERFAKLAQEQVEAQLGRALGDQEAESLTLLAPLIQERVKLLPEAGEQAAFLFGDEVAWDPESWDKVMVKEGAAAAVAEARQRLGDLDEWTAAAIEASLRAMLEATGLSARKGWQPLRVAVTGSVVSPPLFESLEALGRGRSLQRLAAASDRLQAR